ncbi:MAG: lysostaphin resistance A-like protein [Armatimonadota bacterium]
MTGLIALVAGLWSYPRVFPISGLRLMVLRGEAQQIASRFLSQIGMSIPPAYARVTTFHVVGSAKTYLEQNLGIPKANEVAQKEGFVYIWRTRWFRPGTEEEYFVGVDPEGRVLSCGRRLPTDAPMPPSRQPRKMAEEFLKQVIGIDLREYRLIGEDKTHQPARVDYSYVWERDNFRLAESKQRITITVSGDRVIYYSRYLHVPERFTYSYREQRALGRLIALVAQSLSLIFEVAMVAVLLFGMVRKELRWKGALIPAVLVSGVYLLNVLNTIPLRIAEMETDQTWPAFWTGEVVGNLFAVLLEGIVILLMVASAELVYRKAFPNAIPLYFWFTRHGWAHPEGKKRIALGYWLFAIAILYVTLFLSTARRFMGAWASSVVPYDDLMSTAAPWAYPLLVGIKAAIREEILFRVFIISLFRRYLKSTWAGIVVGAVVWSALHCSYPTVPYYLRFVELLLPAVLWGWIVAQFGPLTTIVTHALYNMAVGSDIFLYGQQWQTRLSFGMVIFCMALPALLSWYWSRRLGAQAMQNSPVEQETLGPPLAGEIPSSEASPIARKVNFPTIGRRGLWLSAGAFLVTLVLAYGSHRLTEAQQRFRWAEGETNPFRVHFLDAQQAVEKARSYLPAKGKEVSGWLVGARSIDAERGSEPEYEYLRRFLSQKDAESLWERIGFQDGMWHVRWWNTGSREEWYVLLTPEGGFWQRYCFLPEEAPGKKISKQQAQQIAEAALKELGFPLQHLRLTDSTSYEYPARSAHSFRWRIEGLQVGKAQFWVVVGVNGDVATNVYREIDVPSGEMFRREVSTVRRVVGGFAIAIVALILFGWSWRVTVQTIRRYRSLWRWALQPATTLTLLSLVLALLRYPELVSSTPETLPPEVFVIAQGISVLILGAVIFLATMMAAPFVAAWQALYPTLPDPIDWWRALWHPHRYRRVWREAIIAQTAIWSALSMVFLAVDTVELLARPGSGQASVPQWLVQTRVNFWVAPLGIASYSPFLFALGLSLLIGLLLLVVWFGALPNLKLMFGNMRRCMLWYFLLTLPGALLFAERWEALQYVLGIGLFFAGSWVLYRLVLRLNPLTLFVFGVHLICLFEGSALLHYPSHRVGGVFLLMVVVASFLWAFVDWLIERRSSSISLATRETLASNDV